jgi:pilus assembly protein CpaC
MTRFRSSLPIAALAAVLLLDPQRGSGAEAPPPASLSIDVDAGDMIRLPRPASHVFIANPEIADVQVPQSRTVLVQGKKPGRTTLIALDDKGAEVGRVQIVVSAGLDALQERLRRDYPEIAVTLEATPTSLLIAGAVDAPEQAHGIVELAAAYVPATTKLINRLAVNSQVQVQLRVQVAEISRQVAADFGINLQAVFKQGDNIAGLITGRSAVTSLLSSNGSSSVVTRGSNGASSATDNTIAAGIGNGTYGLSAVLDLLGREGLSTILAEPNLTAISGQTASFLAGGEIPVVTQNGLSGTSVIYKEYGVKLNFTPTVLSHGRISLAVRPEVSELSSLGSVTTDGVTIPALTTRRVDTTVELGSGDCLAIGGLLQKNRDNTNNRVPGLGDIPVIGKLFQSQTFVDNESELVVFVTPYIVQPTKPDAIATAERPAHAATPVDRLMLGHTGDGALPQPPAALQGKAGFAF